MGWFNDFIPNYCAVVILYVIYVFGSKNPCAEESFVTSSEQPVDRHSTTSLIDQNINRCESGTSNEIDIIRSKETSYFHSAHEVTEGDHNLILEQRKGRKESNSTSGMKKALKQRRSHYEEIMKNDNLAKEYIEQRLV